jgi:hypothetical protein
VVQVIRNHHIAGPVHRQAIWGVEASEDALTVLQGFLFVPSHGGYPARGRELYDSVARAEKASAVAQHKHAVGLPEPGDVDSGHGSFEGGKARTLGGRARCHFCEDL